MQLAPFHLDLWLDAHERHCRYNLAASTGPVWTVDELLALADGGLRAHYLAHRLTYSPASGTLALREAIAERYGVSPDEVQIVTGAAEALLILMWLAAEPGANVVLPAPGFPTFSALPQSLGVDTRFYRIGRHAEFRIDVDEIKGLVDDRTKLVVVNTPHNPTGAVLSDGEMDDLHDFLSPRGVQLVSDEVYHPIYHGSPVASAARLPGATVISDFSKALPFAGTRTGWIIERDPHRREQYKNARGYFTVATSSGGELLAEVAMRNHETVIARTQAVASRNLARLDEFMARRADMIGWVRPRGGLTAFPWLRHERDARALCEAAIGEGVLLVPGDCFDAPAHFRLGFGVSETGFVEGLDVLSTVLEQRVVAA